MSFTENKFDLDNIKTLHMETSSVCNAACPGCPRELNILFDKELHSTSLSLEKTKELFSPEFIKRLTLMYMCGHFGDPAAAPDTIDIFKYFQEHNNKCKLGIVSNGSLRNEKWWAELGDTLKQSDEHYAEFSIDGLSDTNHIYRKNTDFNKIIKNAIAFINEGGNAQWVMLVFKHNQHQVEEARLLAKELGFTSFVKKISRRFNVFKSDGIEPPDEYYNLYPDLPINNNTIVRKMPYPITTPIYTQPIDIKCQAIKEKSLAVTADGIIIPCGFVYRGPVFDPRLKKLLNSYNFQDLANTWETDSPYFLCESVCNTKGTHVQNMKFFNRQKTEITKFTDK